jgi:hypothetical protein
MCTYFIDTCPVDPHFSLTADAVPFVLRLVRRSVSEGGSIQHPLTT